MRPNPDLTKFLNQTARFRVLPLAEERALLALVKGGSEDAVRKLCAHNLKLVITMAARYQNSGLPYEDLVHEGAIGLMNAIRRFDPSTGNKLITYAVWWIRQGMIKAISETSRTIRISVAHEAPIKRMKRAPLRQFIGGLHLEDTEAEAGGSDLRRDCLEHSLSAWRGPVGMDTPIAQDGTTRADTIASEGPQPDQITEAREGADIINRLRGKLPPTHKIIISLYYGLDGARPRSLAEIGVQINLSSERVRQLRDKALAMMQKYAKAYRE